MNRVGIYLSRMAGTIPIVCMIMTFLMIAGFNANAAAPTVDLDADNSSGATGGDFSTTFTAGGSAVSIADTDSDITADFDNDIIQIDINLTNNQGDTESLNVTVTNGGAMILGDGTDGITILNIGGLSTAQLEAILEGIQYSNSTPTPNATSRTVEVAVQDSGATSLTATTTITIAGGGSPTNTPTPVPAGNTTEDFENAANQGGKTSPFTTSNGITFTLSNGTLDVADDGFGDFVLFVDGDMVNPPNLTITVGSGDFILTSLEVDGTNSTNNISVDAQDASNNSVAAGGPSPNPQTVLGGLSDTIDHSDSPITIRKIVITGVDQTEGFTIDDIIFSAVSTPTNTPTNTHTNTPVPNNAPTLDLDADNSSGETGSNYTTTFDLTRNPVAIADTDSDAADIDIDTDIAAITITLTNFPDGPNEFLDSTATIPANIVVLGDGSPIIQITNNTGNATTAEFEQVLEGILYTNNNANPDITNRSISVIATDKSFNDSAMATTTITVLATPTPTPTNTSTATSTPTPTPTSTPTNTPTSTSTSTPTLSGTATPTPVSTSTPTPTTTSTSTQSPTATGTATPTPVSTSTPTPTTTSTSTQSPTPTPVLNNAPSFTGAGTLPSVAEDTSNSAGNNINTIMGANFSDTDSDSFAGIAVSNNAGNSTTQGSWQYSTDNGTNWFSIGSVSIQSALLLNNNTLLRFIPISNFNGAPGSLSVHAVDNSGVLSSFTSGSSRITFNTTTDDGTSAVSAAGVFIQTSITAVNDAPTAVNRPDVVVNEDAPNMEINLGDYFNDIENSDSQLLYTLDGFSNSFLFDEVKIQFNILTLNFSNNHNGSSTINITATDTGGETVTNTVKLVVNPINDPPELFDFPLHFVEWSKEGTLSGSWSIFNSHHSDSDEFVIAGAANHSPIQESGTLVELIVDIKDNAIDQVVPLQFLVETELNEGSISTRLVNGSINISSEEPVVPISTITTGNDPALKLGHAAGMPGQKNIRIPVMIENVSQISAYRIAVDFPNNKKRLADIHVTEGDNESTIQLHHYFNDVDSDTLTFSVVDNSNPDIFTTPPEESINSDGLLTLQYSNQAHGTATLTVQASDNKLNSVENLSFTIRITPVVNTPSLIVQPASGNDGSPISLSISAVFDDPNEDHRIEISNVPEQAQLNAGTNTGFGIWVLSPDDLTNLFITTSNITQKNFSLHVKAISTETSSNQSKSVEDVLQVTIDAPKPPLLFIHDAQGFEDINIPLLIWVVPLGTAVDKDITIHISNLPDGSQLSNGTEDPVGTWKLTADQLANLSIQLPKDFDQDFTLMVKANSSEAATTTTANISLHVDVIPTNDSPVSFPIQNITLMEDESDTVMIDLASAFEDIEDGDNLSYTITLENNDIFDSHSINDSKQLILNYIANTFGKTVVHIMAKDSGNLTALHTVNITIEPVLDPFHIDDMKYQIDEDSILPIQLPEFDSDRNPIRYSVHTNPTNGIVVNTAPELLYIPNWDVTENDAFTLTANNSINTIQVKINITINSVNDPPIAWDGMTSISVNEEAALLLSGTDVDNAPESLRYFIFSNPTHGSLTGTPPMVTYTPDLDFSGLDSFTFVVSDGTLQSEPATFNINVTSLSAKTGSPRTNDPNISLSQNQLTYVDLQNVFDYDIMMEPGGENRIRSIDKGMLRIDTASLPSTYIDETPINTMDSNTSFLFAPLFQQSLDAIGMNGQSIALPIDDYDYIYMSVVASPGDYTNPLSSFVVQYADGSESILPFDYLPGWNQHPGSLSPENIHSSVRSTYSQLQNVSISSAIDPNRYVINTLKTIDGQPHDFGVGLLYRGYILDNHKSVQNLILPAASNNIDSKVFLLGITLLSLSNDTDDSISSDILNWEMY